MKRDISRSGGANLSPFFPRDNKFGETKGGKERRRRERRAGQERGKLPL